MRDTKTIEHRGRAFDAWRKRFFEECSISQREEGLRRAGQPVHIYQSDETGELLWAVSTEDDFWMDAFETEEEAEQFVDAIGWPRIGDDEK